MAPGLIQNCSIKKESSADDNTKSEDSPDALNIEDPSANINKAQNQEKEIEDEDEDDSLPVSSQFEQLQSRLLGSLNKDLIDQIAVDFAWINSKGARKRLIRLLLMYSKSKAELLPFFGRLIACLNPYIPEIGATVIKSVS